MNNIIENLEWRYATKKYDSSKKISNEDFNVIKETLRLTPSAYGLQPLKFLIIENPEIRLKLVEKSYGQQQVAEASHLIILCSYIDINSDHVQEMVNLMSKTRNLPLESVDGFKNYVNQTLEPLSIEIKSNSNAKQAYIALGNLLHTCATLRIDATPMEGFDPAGYDEVLGLNEKNLRATLVCPIGYRHEEDKYQYLKKVRRNHEDLFEII